MDVRIWLALGVAALVLYGCSCADGPLDCPSGQRNDDGVCITPIGMDGSVDEDSGPPTMPSMDAGPKEDAEICASGLLCGTPAMCCAEGTECIQGLCVPPCASGVRCGDALDVCCESGEVCVGECTAPGDPCQDAFDCPIGDYCEPALGQCIPQFDTVTCTITPNFSPFDVKLEWKTDTSLVEPGCVHPITTPVIIDLNKDQKPEVIVNMACASPVNRGILRALDGVTGEEKWAVTNPGAEFYARASIAAGDLNGNGFPEIVGLSYDQRGIAIDAQGTVLWKSRDALGDPLTLGYNDGAPTLADLDGDGKVEIIWGALVLSHEGILLWTMGSGVYEGTNNGYTGGLSAVADIDMDGKPEVVSGRRAWEHDGTAKWTGAGIATDGYPAVANFDGDPQPEVVLVTTGNVYVLDGLTGAVEWGPVAIPGGGRGGPPTVADFDGDGLPEIGVAGASSYSVYDPDGPQDVLWSKTTRDMSSNASGSSVFDFEGDGVAEVVYTDECFMRVYRGTDGTVLLEIPNSTGTIHDYPLVADVDSDGNSEIIIVANSNHPGVTGTCGQGDPSYDGIRNGVFVYGDKLDQWMRTRRVWNQHTYHVTNVFSSGEIPAVEVDNWSSPGLNNYRQNTQGEGVFNAPDLAIQGLDVTIKGCPKSVILGARVVNEGSLGVAAGVPVSFYYGTPTNPGALIG
ncbi:MAG: VCBS repeat-containing protein, partial [Myxococcales bacterium]|nr:VCBS repeat-containing protein [Myxococcales bacterium]